MYPDPSKGQFEQSGLVRLGVRKINVQLSVNDMKDTMNIEYKRKYTLETEQILEYTIEWILFKALGVVEWRTSERQPTRRARQTCSSPGAEGRPIHIQRVF